eukprot:COSAG02_NODE_18902_length_911_cov_1.253695_1_plen_47_part_00
MGRVSNVMVIEVAFTCSRTDVRAMCSLIEPTNIVAANRNAMAPRVD